MCVYNRFSILSKILLLLLLIAIIPWRDTFSGKFARNMAARTTLHEIRSNSSDLNRAFIALSQLSQDDCHSLWLQGLVLEKLGLDSKRDEIWEASLYCSSDSVPYLMGNSRNRPDWAQIAVSLYPDEANSWFWLAMTYTDPNSPGTTKPLSEQDRVRVILLFQQGLKLAPFASIRWRELGDLLRDTDPQHAIHAYLQSCYNGDPGSNGCYRAGRVAEEMGDFTAAIRYYRLSHWSGAHERANRLEVQPIETHNP